MKRQFIKLSVEGLIDKIAYYEANGFDFEAKTLRSLFKMNNEDEKLYQEYLRKANIQKERRAQGFY